MSLPILHVKPEDLNTEEKRGKYTVCIVGCGQVGVLHAVLFADSGFKVICFDSDQIVVNNIAKGKAPFSGNDIEGKMKNHVKTGHVIGTSDIKKAISESNIIAVAIPARIDSKKKADFSNIERTCKLIGPSLRAGSIIIFAKPMGMGVIEGPVKEILENSSGFKAGAGFGLAYSPFHTLVEQGRSRIVAAADKDSLAAASVVLASTTKTPLEKTGNIKAAEVATLFGIQQEDVGVALANELAIFCEKLGVDYSEVVQLLKETASAFPSQPMLSDSNVQEEPYVLLTDAENMNVKLWIPSTAREINEHMARHAVNLVKDALKGCGKTLTRARISLLGISATPNVKNRPKKILKDIVQGLTVKGARISVHDPYFSENDLTEMQQNFKKNLAEAVEGSDCIVILTGHDQFKRLNLGRLKIIMRMPAAVVDFEGIVEPSKAEKEGLIYRGLGRGVWTK